MTVDIVPPARLGETALPDGRVLGWAEWGPHEGMPVLLSPGAATSRWLGCGAFGGLGVRLVSVDRPGLGASTAAPGRTFADFAADIRAFAAKRELGNPAMVGNSQGGPFALACAGAGVVSALALVSCADEVAAPEFDGRIPAELRDIVTKAREDPAGAVALFAGFDADAMWDMVIANSPDVDLAVYREPSFEAAYRRALAEAFQQGSAGYARDTLLAMSRWPFRLDGIAVPVDVWYGEKDVSHSPDNGEWLTSRIPGAHRHLVPDAGGSLLWTHAEAILRRLLSHIERH
ncbi:alpha/beta hydrolase [Amycolatopsis minnesotensis]